MEKKDRTENKKAPEAEVETASRVSALLRNYVSRATETSELPPGDPRPILQGLFGEVGSVMATAKKSHREGESYTRTERHRNAVVEELGDTLWYFNALCGYLGHDAGEIFSGIIGGGGFDEIVVEEMESRGTAFHDVGSADASDIDELLLSLGEAASALLSVRKKNGKDKKALSLLRTFADRYLRVVQTKKIAFDKIVQKNLDKIWGRFMEPDYSTLCDFDKDFPEDERLPEKFRIEITQRKSGRSYMRWQGVFIGDPLTDNMINEDGYRFHDVFHLSYAAILHWSPIFRGLIKHKRKSRPEIDEAEDGGRARVVEEGVSAWIFSQAKDLDFFQGQDQVSFDLLKDIQNFVKGYQVEKCPLRLWERAILEGYEVFRQVKESEGGIVIGNRKDRTISYEPLPKPKPES